AVAHERLVRLAQAQLPGQARVRDRRLGRSPRAAVVPADEDDVRLALRHARGDGADADLRHQLHADARAGVGVLQVVDELRQVLDRIDVVVRGRRDQADVGRRVARLGDPGVDLLGRELAAFAGLGALRHLDLDLVGAREVADCHAETARGHLLDPAPLRAAADVPVGVFAAFARI